MLIHTLLDEVIFQIIPHSDILDSKGKELVTEENDYCRQINCCFVN